MKGGIFNPTGSRLTVLTFTRLKAAISGDVVYTGAGFRPTSILFIARSDSAGGSGFSMGMESLLSFIPEGLQSVLSNNDRIIDIYNNASGGRQAAVLKTIDSDGFTLTWTKGGAGSDGDITFKAVCFK